jgi:hypothetical protein
MQLTLIEKRIEIFIEPRLVIIGGSPPMVRLLTPTSSYKDSPVDIPSMKLLITIEEIAVTGHPLTDPGNR